MKRIMTATLAVATILTLAAARGRGTPAQSMFVTSDGTAFIATAKQMQAVREDGSVAWTAPLTARPGRMIVSGNNLITVSEASDPTFPVVATLTAFSTASGEVTWSQKIPSHITDLQPFKGGTYAVIVCPAPASGGTATPWLGAFGDDGTLRWTVGL
jgi:hypothetical protein